MTAWLGVVAPMCLAAKCCVDFIVLEYGSKFRLVTDEQFIIACVIICGYAIVVDSINFAETIVKVRRGYR